MHQKSIIQEKIEIREIHEPGKLYSWMGGDFSGGRKEILEAAEMKRERKFQLPFTEKSVTIGSVQPHGADFGNKINNDYGTNQSKMNPGECTNE